MQHSKLRFSLRFSWLIIFVLLLLSACDVQGAPTNTTIPHIFINSLNGSGKDLTNTDSMTISMLHSNDGKVAWQQKAQ